MKYIIPLLLVIVGCSVDIPEPVLIDDPSISLEPGASAEIECTTEAMTCVVDANNAFAFKIFNEYNAQENVFVSPWSISSALAMTYEGARGTTAEEMAEVLNMVGTDARREGFKSIYDSINKGSDDYKLSTANALWAQVDYPFLQEYFDQIDANYDGKLSNLDFKRDTENSRLTINSWVEDNTNDKIKDLIPQGKLDSMTRLVLTNAVYFKGDWVYEFDKSDTKKASFQKTVGSVQADMMQRTDDDVKFGYYEDDSVQVLEMPYKGDRLSMVVALPKENMDSMDISQDAYDKWTNGLTTRQVKVYFPKFKFETKYFMANTLAKMGMPTAFSMAADFSGMTGNDELFISSVIHQTFVEVDEKGTEAAAATAVIMDLKSAGPREVPVFKADHPFLFFIRDKETGTILFMGRVEDPTV